MQVDSHFSLLFGENVRCFDINHHSFCGDLSGKIEIHKEIVEAQIIFDIPMRAARNIDFDSAKGNWR